MHVFDAEENSGFGPRGTYLRYMLFDPARREAFGADYN